MAGYVARRLVTLVPLLLIISFFSFFILSLVPGDPVELLITSDPGVKPEDVERLRKIYGLDDPVAVRYGKWLKRLAVGDLGFSRTYKTPVGEILLDRVGNTLALVSGAFLLALIVAVPLGALSAVKKYSWFDHLVTFVAFFGISVPVFWLGLVLIALFAVHLRWLPAGGMGGWQNLILPTVVLSAESIAGWSRYVRGSMLEVLSADYIRTARAKGLPEGLVIRRHALRNALLPLITLFALAIPGLFSGALITETVFAWPGMGRLLYDSVMGNDYYLAMMAFMFLAALTILANLAADIAYAYADPRIKYDA